MYPHPPPGPSSTPQAPLIRAPVGAQSYAHLSYINPTAQHNSQHRAQSICRSSQQLPSSSAYQTHLPPSTALPPPPPLPRIATQQGQPLYTLPSFPNPVPPRNLGAPGVPPAPPTPPTSSSQFTDPAVEKCLVAQCVNECVAFHSTVPVNEGKGCTEMGSVGGDDGLSKGSPMPNEFSPPLKTGEPGSPIFPDSDTEMEDDITQPDNDLVSDRSSGALKCVSDSNPGVLFNKEQFPTQHFRVENSSAMGASRDLLAHRPGYDTTSSYNQLQQEKDDDGSRQASLPDTGKAANVPESGGGDLYDPFVDSFEPSLDMSKMLTHVQEHELACDSAIVPMHSVSSNRSPDIEANSRGNDERVLGDSGIMPGLSSCSNGPHDIKEDNDGGNGTGPVIRAISVDNEEYGKNADDHAVDDSENSDSPNSPEEVAGPNIKAAGAENGGKKSQEKRKEKEPRSLRLFKVVLTQFVKDLLKPSWRQGNMSKEAFKTIVKKTVDKVSRSLEGRRMPKSRAKIDRYIDSSQHKLTKLVMGYVEKYVKA